MCITVVQCTRLVDVEEHGVESQSVPRRIMDALRAANGYIDQQLKEFEAAAIAQPSMAFHASMLRKAANSLAEQRKGEADAKIDEKVKAMKADRDVQAKTDKVADKAKKSRDLMLTLEKATLDHTRKGLEEDKAVTKFGDISNEYDDLARKINLKAP
eukprot:Skav227001  [mRNA]  locus=scaffold4219:179320:184152:- [translate_table: standard]